MAVVKLTTETFDQEVLQAGQTVLVDFYADWCGPCKMMAPVVEELAGEEPDVKVCKINEGRPNILDKITNGKIQLIVNTPLGKKGATDDSYIRKAAIKNKIPYITTMAAAKATVEAIRSAKRDGKLPVKSLQEFHAEITDK